MRTLGPTQTEASQFIAQKSKQVGGTASVYKLMIGFACRTASRILPALLTGTIEPLSFAPFSLRFVEYNQVIHSSGVVP